MGTLGNFGLGTTNLAAGVGMGQAMETIGYQTALLKMQCQLQEDFARELGGYENKGTSTDPNYQVSFDSNGRITSGILGQELTMQINSADNAADAIKDDAKGTLDSAIVGTVTTLATVATIGGIGFKGGSKETNEEISNLKSFKEDLSTSTPEEEDEDLVVTSADTPDDNDKIEARIQKWKGSDLKEADFSDYTKEGDSEEAILNRKAMKRLREEGRTTDLDTVQRNADLKISRLKIQNRGEKTSHIQTFTQVISQADTAGQGYAKYHGQMEQSSATQASQEETAYASVLEKAIQSVNQQASTAAQAASQYQQEIANTLQNIAAPA